MAGVRRRVTRKGAAARDGADAAVFRGSKATEANARPSREPRGPDSRSSQGLKPDLEEILAAIKSLYADQLKPFGRILRKRIAERAVALTGHDIPPTLPDIDVKYLKAQCEACRRITVEPEPGGDWSAVLVDQPGPFVDIYSSDDVYSEQFWTEAKAYFQSLGKDEMFLPGGRYLCAKMLLARKLPFLASYTLGQVCHVVQLALAKWKLLGYSDGAVVPYEHSQSKIKELCAESQQSCTVPEDACAIPTVSWEVARRCVREILAETGAARTSSGPVTVPLCSIKRSFLSKYKLELSETALGHSKLSELLSDERFGDVCKVELGDSGYVVVQVRRVEFCADEPLCFDVEGGPPNSFPVCTPVPSPGDPPTCKTRLWGLDERPREKPERPTEYPQRPSEYLLRPAECLSSYVQATPANAYGAWYFPPYVPPMYLPPLGLPRRADYAAQESKALTPTKAKKQNQCVVGDPLRVVRRGRGSQPTKIGRFDTMVQNTFIHESMPPPSPPPGARQRSLTVPMDFETFQLGDQA